GDRHAAVAVGDPQADDVLALGEAEVHDRPGGVVELAVVVEVPVLLQLHGAAIGIAGARGQRDVLPGRRGGGRDVEGGDGGAVGELAVGGGLVVAFALAAEPTGSSIETAATATRVTLLTGTSLVQSSPGRGSGRGAAAARRGGW